MKPTILDRRREFRHEPWQQGHLLATNETRQWPLWKKAEVDYREKCTAYASLSEEDEGKSREYLYIFPTPEECAANVKRHNMFLPKPPSLCACVLRR